MNDTAPRKNAIVDALRSFDSGAMVESARRLFDVLGYQSERCLDLDPNTAERFCQQFDRDGRLNSKKALLSDWDSVDLVFQLTAHELTRGGQLLLREGFSRRVDDTVMESYLLFAVRLRDGHYTRTQLADVTREVNKLFPMPALLLFRHGPCLTLAVIDRRLNRRDESRDVLQKVTLIKDIRFTNPHRAHVEILFDLSLPELQQRHAISNFVELHRAWQETLDSSELNRRFYREVANWYFWATGKVTFPQGAGTDAQQRNSTSLIRLITRLIFVWFLKEKGLVPEELFDKRGLDGILSWADPQGSTYYKAILQNLFFATLNQEMNTAEQPYQRKFRGEARNAGSRDPHYMVHNVYRYRSLFQHPEKALQNFSSVPFLNGGLFECLDHPAKDDPDLQVRVDAFSDRADNVLCVPDELFFGEERQVNLDEAYGTSGKRYPVRGLLKTLERFKFTVDENTPIEQEVALDPELLGQVFENLLAAYVPETGVTARKQTGSFYTPREIVNYMVDESLLAYLENALREGASRGGSSADLAQRLRHLLSYTVEDHQFSESEVQRIIAAIDSLKVLDPACGSGAYPMGVLHKLVFILHKMDPGNARWKNVQIAKASEIPDATVRERTLADIEQSFARHSLDYGRKLYLIENCIYGVDIQPIAVQIAKLRCFISLIVDQEIDDAQPNRGIRALPNLETKFVAANSLLRIEGAQIGLRTPDMEKTEQELAEVRRRLFSARSPATKDKYRQEDQRLRGALGRLLQASGLSTMASAHLASWDPYDQNSSADFFDPEWMFGVNRGFDIVIGNPPYIRHEHIRDLKPALQGHFECYTGTADLYVYFYERGFQLLADDGVLTYISSNKYFRSAYGEKLRAFLGTRSTIRQLVDFGDTPVFSSIAYPSIIVFEKRPPDGNQTRALTWQPGLALEEFPSIFAASSFLLAQKELTASGWCLESSDALLLLEKLRKAGPPLGEYVHGHFYRGILTGLNEAFVVDRATRDRLIAEDPASADLLKPFLRGRDIKRWQVNYADLYLIRIESSENVRHPWSGKAAAAAEKVFASTYPAIYQHMRPLRAALIERDDQGHFFWELRSCAYWSEFERPKIVYPDIAQCPQFAFDPRGYYLANTSYLLPTDDKWLLGVLNSRLVFWFYIRLSSQIQGGFVRYIAQYVTQIPIRSGPAVGPIGAAVQQILAAAEANPDADTSALEREIDRLVYELYGLTQEEIAIVESQA
jgi:hypothetical protein